MAGAGQAIQLIVPEGLMPSAIRQTRPIADGVIDIIGLVDLCAGGRQLMQDSGHLTGGIVEGGLHVMFIACILGSSSWYGV